MREFKFRVWDNLINGYSTHLRCNVYEFFDSADGNVQYACVDVGAAFLSPPDGQIIEQFTGLRDKNRREIYEGDIVKIVTENGFLNHWMAVGEKYVVEYEKYGFSPFKEYDSDCCQYLMPEWCEIIGNIHENPELLK